MPRSKKLTEGWQMEKTFNMCRSLVNLGQINCIGINGKKRQERAKRLTFEAAFCVAKMTECKKVATET
jgi:hypothetical protein